MKTSVKLKIAAVIVFILTHGAIKTRALAAESVTFQVFYESLSPFGKWLKDDVNGYVWVPKVEKGFRPYFTNGSWKMTEYGCTWVSSYTWGWAAFHYGRWIFDSLYGWVWIPGYDWGPAWVVWRSDGEYYGWTPFTPGYTVSQALSPNYLVPADWWVFIPGRYLLNAAFQTYAVSSAEGNTVMLKRANIVNNSRATNNANYISGPRAMEFGRATGKEITVYLLQNAAKPGKAIVKTDKEIILFRPVIKKWESGSEPKPVTSVHAEPVIGKTAALGPSAIIKPAKATAKKKTTAKPASGKKKSK